MSVDRIPLPRTDGSLWLCALRDVAHDPEAMLAFTGASTIVCLNERSELDRREPSYVDWLRRHQPGRALWFPIRNFRAESAVATMPFLQMIIDRLEAGDGVVMHCAMGRGRAGTMAVCVLMMLGASQEEALHTVASSRAFAGPGESSQWALVDDVARELASGSDDSAV